MSEKITKIEDTGKKTGVALDPKKPTEITLVKVYRIIVEQEREILMDQILAEKAQLLARITEIDELLALIP